MQKLQSKVRTLIFDSVQWENLQFLCEDGYPKEVCGLLFGKAQNGFQVALKDEEGRINSPLRVGADLSALSSPPERKVVKVEPLSNILDGRHPDRLKELMDMNAISLDKERALGGGRTEFLIDPVEHYRKVSAAERDGLDLIGLFHSHPDHPPRPSPTDAAQPSLSGWSNVIAEVRKKKFVSAHSWYRETENSSFQEEQIVVE